MGEIRRRLLQDLVGVQQLEVLALDLLQALSLLGRQSGPRALVPLGLSDPATQRLGGTSDLLGDR
jgi:hypothetical protein